MKYLNPGEYLGNNSIDLYLLQHWVKEKDISPVLYLWIEAVTTCSRQEAPLPEQCSAIRRRLLLPIDGSIPMRPIACVVHEHDRDHYLWWYSIIGAFMLQNMVEITAWIVAILTIIQQHGVVRDYGGIRVYYSVGTFPFHTLHGGLLIGNRWLKFPWVERITDIGISFRMVHTAAPLRVVLSPYCLPKVQSMVQILK